MEEDKTMYIRIRFGDSHFHFPLIEVAKFIYEYFTNWIIGTKYSSSIG